MERIRLIFESIQQVVGNENLSVIVLTDEPRQRAISVICDEQMTRQILFRLQSPDKAQTLLPESLLQMLTGQYEMMIYGVHDGQYQVVLSDSGFECSSRIRMSDAVLLTIISGYPLYIEENLMRQQCYPFDQHAQGVSIPINTIDMHRLNTALQNAIEVENYELASQLRDEINRRKKNSPQH
jgi:bifunctional DNase/RNase